MMPFDKRNIPSLRFLSSHSVNLLQQDNPWLQLVSHPLHPNVHSFPAHQEKVRWLASNSTCPESNTTYHQCILQIWNCILEFFCHHSGKTVVCSYNCHVEDNRLAHAFRPFVQAIPCQILQQVCTLFKTLIGGRCHAFSAMQNAHIVDHFRQLQPILPRTGCLFLGISNGSTQRALCFIQVIQCDFANGNFCQTSLCRMKEVENKGLSSRRKEGWGISLPSK